jgi:hypothetical protein
LKTKILAVTASVIIGAGAYMHSGDKPRCLLQLFASKKTEVKAQPATAALAGNVNVQEEKNKKHHARKNQDAKGHEKKCLVK